MKIQKPKISQRLLVKVSTRIRPEKQQHGQSGPFTTLIFCLAAFIILTSVGCGTSKQFTIQSFPEGALVEFKKENYYRSEYIGETPIQEEVYFFGEEKYQITLEKRGYAAATKSITLDSPEIVTVDLERIPNVSEEVFDQKKLLSTTFYLLPVDFDVIIHSGVGNLDKKEKSDAKSTEAAQQFYNALIQTNNNQIKPLDFLDHKQIQEQWNPLISEVNTYLKSLTPAKLQYYSLPPCISTEVEAFTPFINDFAEYKELDNAYLLYIKGMCLSETTGRKVGNTIFSIIGPAVATATPTYYDPSAFQASTGTVLSLFVIDPRTSEVLFIDSKPLSYLDITKPDQLTKAVDTIREFPKNFVTVDNADSGDQFALHNQ